MDLPQDVLHTHIRAVIVFALYNFGYIQAHEGPTSLTLVRSPSYRAVPAGAPYVACAAVYQSSSCWRYSWLCRYSAR